MKKEYDSKYVIKSLQKALDIVESFTVENPELTLTDLQRMLDLDKTNIYRIIVNLEERGILQRNPKNGKLRLGSIMLYYARICMSGMDIDALALPYMNKLAQVTGETVIINAIQADSGICIARVNSSNPVKITADLGNRVPLLRGASSKILAAYLPKEYLRRVYEQEKEELKVSYDEILRQMKEIRTNGYAVSLAELDPQTAGVSFPIFDMNNEVIAGLSIIGPLYRFTEENIPEFIQEVRVCAMEISRAMGYRK
ncbi:IclR family transcriptional regulator [Mediterraneibacter sp. NSJ-55]|uniref:IclR family transcriptional regulator n=1 Tax=Mediterraneibacter hominis TaxID=2763054 RepID=A0A923LHM1_9FIRM|nr:IclR family transcriptional regulator [Mediterraneibacter hominis]MBC5688942.1 IclR family transcriptional regulator [Mediterraneibacter hominis]